MSISIRNFISGDMDKYIELYNYVHPQQMTSEQWCWRNLKGPLGRSIINAAWDGDRLVGFYGLIPILLLWGGRTLKGALSDIAVTHPNYRYRGIFSELGKSLYGKARDQGIKLIYGFPTDHSIYGFQRKMDWSSIGRGRILYLWSGTDIIDMTEKVYIVKKIDEEIECLWRQVASGSIRGYSAAVRNKKYIKWRYFECPDKKYDIFMAEDGSGNASGCVITCRQEDGSGEYLDIVDVLAQDIATFRKMIGYLASCFSESTPIRLMLPEGSPFYLAAKGMGFKEGGKEYFFGWKLLQGHTGSPEEWYYTFSDVL